MVVVLERQVGELQLAAPLDVDLTRTVDHDLGDALVTEERFEWAKADDLVGDLLEHSNPLGTRKGEALLVDDLAEDLFDLAPYFDLVAEVELGVEVGDDALLDAVLRIAERLTHRHLGHHPPWRSRRRGDGLARRGSRSPGHGRLTWLAAGGSAAIGGTSALDSL